MCYYLEDIGNCQVKSFEGRIAAMETIAHVFVSLSLVDEQEDKYDMDDDQDHTQLECLWSYQDHIESLKNMVQRLKAIPIDLKNGDLDLLIEGLKENMLVELRPLSNRPANMKNRETREGDFIFPKFLSDVEYFLRYSEIVRTTLQDMSTYTAEYINEKLLLLQGLVIFVANVGRNIDVGGKEVFATLCALIDKSTFLLYSCLDGVVRDMGDIELAMYHNLLEKNKVKEIYIAVLRASNFRYFTGIIPLKCEIHLLIVLIRILKYRASFKSWMKESCMKLHDELDKLQKFLRDLPREVTVHKLSYLVPSTEAIISSAIPIIYSPYDDNANKDMVNGSLQVLCDQIDRIQAGVFEGVVIEAGVFEMKLYKYPKIDELGFLNLFLEHLEELLKFRPKLIENLKNQIQTLHDSFDSLIFFLRKIEIQRAEHEELEDLWTRTIELAYHTEYIIDLSVVKIARGMCIRMFSFSNVIEQANLIMSKVKVINDDKKYHSRVHGVAKRSNPLPSQATNVTTDNVVVGFEDEAEKIMEYLLGDTKQLDIITIVGMPGLGKTTLAKKMYEATKAHFDIRAWCTVSQKYQKRELLISLLRDLIIIDKDIKELNDEELAAKLNKCLRGHRYLIVIDDLWGINAWRDLKRTFPNDNFHSRILITTRLHEVASQVKAGSKVHRLRQFSDDESWELFQKKLPKLPENESFCQRFLDVGKQIAESCKGLPLAIVVATGLLAKSKRNINLWEQIAGSLSSHIFSNSETKCMEILELSYIELPDPLKSCFLYVGAFPEDAEIPVKKLKWLWTAEGFVRNSGRRVWRI